MKPCCGNCVHWKDTWTTPKGKLPYYGRCECGHPKQGMFNRGGHKFSHYKYKIRSDSACKDYRKDDSE